MIKAAFFDIDGTLLPHSTGKVPLSTERAMRALREKGISVFAATGRHMPELEELLLGGLCFDGDVLLNGQICTDGAGNLFYAVPIPRYDTERIASLFEKQDHKMEQRRGGCDLEGRQQSPRDSLHDGKIFSAAGRDHRLWGRGE